MLLACTLYCWYWLRVEELEPKKRKRRDGAILIWREYESDVKKRVLERDKDGRAYGLYISCFIFYICAPRCFLCHSMRNDMYYCIFFFFLFDACFFLVFSNGLTMSCFFLYIATLQYQMAYHMAIRDIIFLKS